MASIELCDFCHNQLEHLNDREFKVKQWNWHSYTYHTIHVCNSCGKVLHKKAKELK